MLNGQIKLKCPICTLQNLDFKTVSVPLILERNKNKWIINNYSDIEITYSLNISDGKKDYRDHKD